MPPSRTARRLERLLAAVPYAVKHPGVRVEDLARMFGVSESELVNDLNLLLVTGLPPYTPGDLIEVDVSEGRVWIRMADYFARPVRLTRGEALALYLRGTALLGAPGVREAGALRSALDKLREHLGETLGELRVEVDEEGRPSGPLDAVRAAVRDRQRLEIDYFSASRGELTTRSIDPEHVFFALGNWYVVAWCHRVDGERMFRVDRVRAVRRTGETFEPRGLPGPGRPLYSRSDEDVPVRLRLGPRARWVAEYYEVEERHEREDGRLEVVLPTKELRWIARLLLRLGGEVEVVEPAELAEIARETADQTLALYS